MSRGVHLSITRRENGTRVTCHPYQHPNNEKLLALVKRIFGLGRLPLIPIFTFSLPPTPYFQANTFSKRACCPFLTPPAEEAITTLILVYITLGRLEKIHRQLYYPQKSHIIHSASLLSFSNFNGCICS